MFGYAAVLMYLSAGPLAEGLRVVGQESGVGAFTLVQWAAPLASRAPWIVLIAVLAWRGREVRFNVPAALLTVQVAQWTLLLSLVALAPFLSGLTRGAPVVLMLDHRQEMELLLTAAQSLLLVALLARRCPEPVEGACPDSVLSVPKEPVERLSVSWRSAVLLLSLFVAQWTLVALQPDGDATFVQGLFAAVYVVLAVVVFLSDRERLGILVGAIAPARRAPAPTYRSVFWRPLEACAPERRDAELVASLGANSRDVQEDIRDL